MLAVIRRREQSEEAEREMSKKRGGKMMLDWLDILMSAQFFWRQLLLT